MNKNLRILVLSGVMALATAPVFADGPGGTDPPPSPPPTGGSTSSTSSIGGETSAVILALLSALGL